MKLSAWTIYLVGLFLAIPILAFGYFMNKVPNDAEAAMYESVLDRYNTEAAKMKKAEERRQNAARLVRESAARWRSYVATRTPVTGVERGGAPNLAVNLYQLTVDTRKFRDNLQRAVNAQLHAGGVKILGAPLVPEVDPNTDPNQLLAASQFYNYQAIGFPVVILNLGQVQVQGRSYKQIFDHVRAWANMPHYLAVADSLRLDGTTPNLTGTYNLTLVGFIRGKVISPAVSSTPGGTTAGSPFGGPGGGAPSFGPGGPGFKKPSIGGKSAG